MVDVKVLNFSSESEFKNEEEFIEYFEKFLNGESNKIEWTSKFYKHNKNNMGENDIIIFVYKNIIYGKAKIKRHNSINEGKYKSETIIKDVKETPLIPSKLLLNYFNKKNGHAQINLYVEEEELDNFFIKYCDIEESFRKLGNYYLKKSSYEEYLHVLNKKEEILTEFDYTKLQKIDYDWYSPKRKNNTKNKINSPKKSIEEYENENKYQKKIGDLGENAIEHLEISRLEEVGRNDLAKKVKIVDSDGYGYDIISYNEDGSEKHIEVKTTSKNIDYIEFYLTENELNKMKSDSQYELYYLFDIKNTPKYHVLNKQKLLENEKEFLKPIQYRISINVKDNY